MASNFDCYTKSTKKYKKNRLCIRYLFYIIVIDILRKIVFQLCFCHNGRKAIEHAICALVYLYTVPVTVNHCQHTFPSLPGFNENLDVKQYTKTIKQ